MFSILCDDPKVGIITQQGAQRTRRILAEDLRFFTNGCKLSIAKSIARACTKTLMNEDEKH